jgi:hypothetical protein
MGMKRLALVVALVLLPAAGAATPTVVGPGTIGAYRFEQPRARAIDLFGPPTFSRDGHGINAPAFGTPRCRTTWNSLELVIEYAGPCTAPGRARRAELEGRAWRTREGLRVGDPVAKLKRLYRGARATKPNVAALQELGVALRGIEWDLRRARPASSVIVVTQGTRVVSFELRPASLRSG